MEICDEELIKRNELFQILKIIESIKSSIFKQVNEISENNNCINNHNVDFQNMEKFNLDFLYDSSIKLKELISKKGNLNLIKIDPEEDCKKIEKNDQINDQLIDQLNDQCIDKIEKISKKNKRKIGVVNKNDKNNRKDIELDKDKSYDKSLNNDNDNKNLEKKAKGKLVVTNNTNITNFFVKESQNKGLNNNNNIDDNNDILIPNIENMSEYKLDLLKYLKNKDSKQQNKLKEIRNDNSNNIMKDMIELDNKKEDIKFKRFIYLDDSKYNDYRNVIDTTVNADIIFKNPFCNYEFINYENDSEEDFNDYFAEDLDSKNNSEEDNEDDDESDEEEKKDEWIVSDNYLSNEDLSKNEKEKENLNNCDHIHKIMDVKFDYNKPISIDFTNDNDLNSSKLKNLLMARVFKFRNLINRENHRIFQEDINNLEIENENNERIIKFPLTINPILKLQTHKIENNSTNNIFINIETVTQDLIKMIHYNFETNLDKIKENLLLKFKVKKKDLDKFFKENVIKSKCEVTKQVSFIFLKEYLQNKTRIISKIFS